jgi:hypothetical protein
MDDLPVLTVQYHPSGRRDMGRPNQRWEDQQRLQDQEQAFVDVNVCVHGDGGDKLLSEKRVLLAASKHPAHFVKAVTVSQMVGRDSLVALKGMLRGM